MSKLSAFELTCLPESLGRDAPVDLLRLMLRFGWTFDDNGEATFLPLGDKDDFDWQHVFQSDEQVLSIVSQKHQAGEIPGVVLTWKDSGIGGQVIFHPGCAMSFIPNINRQSQAENENLVDINWYTQRIIPALNTEVIRIASFKYEEFV